MCINDWLRAEEFKFYKEPTDDDLEFYKELEELEVRKWLSFQFSFAFDFYF